MYQALLEITHLRYRLMPYLYSQSWKVTSEGYTLMRGLPMDFPGDVKVHNISDSFMFGPAFLVHPVTRAMYRMDNPACSNPADGVPALPTASRACPYNILPASISIHPKIKELIRLWITTGPVRRWRTRPGDWTA